MRNNAYKTNDPEILLRLKRQEADAIRDVLRSINQAHLKLEQIFRIARNTLLAQCGVRKMKFVYRTDEGFRTGVKMGFAKLDRHALSELPDKLEITAVTEATHPSLHALGAEYVVPVNYMNEVGAWFIVADFAETEAEVENDLIFTETIGNILSAAIENRHLIRETVEQESLRRELEVAEKIQKQLLITDFDRIKAAKIYAENVSHHKIGGDYYDVIPRGDRGFFICIADVAGKGIGAALLMANLQANVRALILSENSLSDLIHKLHRALFTVTRGEQFVTFFLAHVRTEDGQMDYINAGHNAPLLVHDGKITELKAGTIPLGIVDLPVVQEGSVAYHSGDQLFMYTDGLVEQHNEKDELLGEERVMEKLLEVLDLSVREIIAEMDQLRRAFAGNAIQDDDVTMLAVKF